MLINKATCRHRTAEKLGFVQFWGFQISRLLNFLEQFSFSENAELHHIKQYIYCLRTIQVLIDSFCKVAAYLITGKKTLWIHRLKYRWDETNIYLLRNACKEDRVR